MNYLVATHARCGSTLLSRLLSALTSLEEQFYKTRIHAVLQEDEKLELLSKSNCLLKTHSLPTKDLPDLSRAYGIVTCTRDLADTLVSYLLYNKNTRRKQGLTVDKFLLLMLRDDLDDSFFVNQVVEAQFEYTQRLLHDWSKVNTVLVGRNICSFRYESLVKQEQSEVIERLIRKLNLSVTNEQYEAALNVNVHSLHSTLRDPGGAKRVLSPENYKKIQQEVRKIYER